MTASFTPPRPPETPVPSQNLIRADSLTILVIQE
jgi:hypothetical protein